MAKENYNEEFLEFVKSEKELNDIVLKGSADGYETKLVEGVTIENVDSIRHAIENIAFKSCVFFNITFLGGIEGVDFIECQFKNCSFQNLMLFDNTFVECGFYDIEITDVSMVNCNLINTNFKSLEPKFEDRNVIHLEVSGWDIAYCKFVGVILSNLDISHLNIDGGTNSNNISFENTNISQSVFSSIVLNDIKFTDTCLDRCSFINCKISKNIFDTSSIKKSYESCYIDLQTILKSEIGGDMLHVFGIKNDFAKDYIKDLVTEVTFQSVFISYSFKDKVFARNINELLRRHGVNTFLWERDAPGGKRLTHIMRDNINKHDRLLFIASRDSLKSQACHFELAEARERYKKEWKDIYYPIHIDDFLFKVEKDIIPTEYQDEFWNNILEVRKYNSKDFTQFKTAEDFKSPAFDEAVKQLIKDLKL